MVKRERAMARNNRAFLIGSISIIILLAGILFYQYVHLPFKSQISEINQIQEQKCRTLEKQMSLLARKGSFELERNSLIEMRKTVDTRLVQGATVAIAAEALKQAVKSIITGKGGSIVSENSEKAEDMGKFSIIGVSIEAAFLDIRAFAEALGTLDASADIVVRDVDVRVRNVNEPNDLVARFRFAALTGGKP
jgi:hypothetical protein